MGAAMRLRRLYDAYPRPCGLYLQANDRTAVALERHHALAPAYLPDELRAVLPEATRVAYTVSLRADSGAPLEHRVMFPLPLGEG
jgi:hypothetical protein